MPEALKGQKTLFMNIFGNNAHMLYGRVDADTIFWRYVLNSP